MTVENIKIEAMKVLFGTDIAQQEKITISPSTTKVSLAGKYFVLYCLIAGVIEKHVFWFDTTGTDVAPVVAGATLHKVDISLGTIDTVPEYATTLFGVIDAVVGFTATSSENIVTVVHENVGYAPAGHDALEVLKKTNFGFEILVQGDTEADVGCIEGDIELAFDGSYVDVKCHSEGVTPVANLKNGYNSIEVTLTLLETTKAQLKKMFAKTGGSFIPDGGTEVFGIGTFKNFENMMKYATKLRLHPVRLLDGDKTEDWTFHKALPKLDGASFSGEKQFNLPVTFAVYPDSTKNSRVNYMVIGDSSQSLV